MKKIIAQMFYIKNTQKGVILLFTLFLLFIIATFTIAFFYLQFLEVDLIAHETEYLQAFYLAEAGLNQGKKELDKNPKIIGYIINEYNKYKDFELTCEDLYNRYNHKNYTHIDMYNDMASNKQGTFCYGYKLDSNNPSIEGNVTVIGKGWVNEESESTSEIMNEKRENRREIETRVEYNFTRLLYAHEWHDPNFGEIVNLLGNSIVVSREEPNLQEKIAIFTVDIEGQKTEVSNYQDEILTFSEMTSDQRNDYIDFDQICTRKITKTRAFVPNNPRRFKPNILGNQNRYLFDPNNFNPPKKEKNIIYQNYDSIWLDEIEPSRYGKNWPFPELEYREYRVPSDELPLKPELGVTIRPFMTLKANKQITLKEGHYFFEELILEENSILNADGPVSIYVKRLELKRNAKLMGGTSTDPDKASPNDLYILAQCWPRTLCSLVDDGIIIGSTAKVCGHIFAPGLKVTLCKGYMGKETRVYGSILTYQLVTSRCDAGASPGPIWVIYSEYKSKGTKDIAGSWREVRNP